MIIEKQGRFYIKVNGVYMTDLINNKWTICEFETKEEAEKVLQEYRIFYS